MNLTKMFLCCVVMFGWLSASPVSAEVISYEYIYPTTDGTGGTAVQPESSGVGADLTHNASYTTYSGGELNDGYSFVGAWDSGDGDETIGRYNFWDTGKQVGTNDSTGLLVHPAIIAELDPANPWNVSQVSVNYMVDHRVGIHAPDSVTAYFGTNDGGGINWSTGTTLGSGWNDANPSYPPDGYFAYSDLYLNQVDVSGVTAAHNANYVRLDFHSSDQWTGLVEVDFAGSIVPEPSTFALLVMGGLGLLLVPAWRRWRNG